MPASPAGPLAPSIKHNDLDVSPLKVHERSKPDHFYSKALASSAHLLRLPSSSSICFISCCSEQVLKHRTGKKKKKKDEEILKEKKKKTLPYILSTVPATLQPSQRFLIQIQFSSCFHPHPPSPLLSPSFTSSPHASSFPLSPCSSSFSSPITFSLLPSPPFLSLSFPPLTPVPLLTSPISLPSLPLSLGGNMKGYLCADSQGRSRAES